MGREACQGPVLVTGATGFIGNHVVAALLHRGASVIAGVRSLEKAERMPWFSQVDCRLLDLADLPDDPFSALGAPRRMIHLAWAGLPDYRSPVHLKRNLPMSRDFLCSMLGAGLKQVLVAGTCFEYGLQEGELVEETPPRPCTPYGEAKDLLRRDVSAFARERGAVFQWARLFYLYGPGQGEKSLFSQLQRAIDDKAPDFDMSGGEQIRDFIPVKAAAEHLVDILSQDRVTGIVNVCGGRAVPLKTLVEEYLARQNAPVRLNLGRYPYPDYEPFRFWGSTAKLRTVSRRERP